MSALPTPAPAPAALQLVAGEQPAAAAAAGHPYTPQDLDKASTVDKWLQEHQQTRSWLARKLRTSSSTISQVLTRKYPSPPTEWLDKMLSVLQVESERLIDGTPGYVEGSVHKLAFVVFDRTRKHGNYGVLVANVGVGKTRTAKEYRLRKPQTLLVEANPHMTAGSLLTEILDQLGVVVPHGVEAKFIQVVKALRGTNYLLIVDEAETISGMAAEYVRRIRDKAQIGVVLMGTTKLHAQIAPEHGQFEQIRSRVSMWPQTVEAISRDDADEIARAALPDEPLPDDVLDALWAYGAGSARMLTESLVPALRDYAVGKLKLSAKVVDEIAAKVLFLKRRSAA